MPCRQILGLFVRDWRSSLRETFHRRRKTRRDLGKLRSSAIPGGASVVPPVSTPVGVRSNPVAPPSWASFVRWHSQTIDTMVADEAVLPQPSSRSRRRSQPLRGTPRHTESAHPQDIRAIAPKSCAQAVNDRFKGTTGFLVGWGARLSQTELPLATCTDSRPKSQRDVTNIAWGTAPGRR